MNRLRSIFVSSYLERTIMNIDREKLQSLITRRIAEIEKAVVGTGYLPKTVIGVGTYLLDNECDVDLLTANQQVTFERFIKPLL